MQKKKIRICRILLFWSLLLLLSAGGFGKKLAGIFWENTVTLVSKNGDGTGSYRLKLASGDGTFHLPLSAEGWKTERADKKSGEWVYRIPGTDGRLIVKVSFFQEQEEMAERMERDASYYKSAVRNCSGYDYLETGWLTRTDALVCVRFRLKSSRASDGIRYLSCAVVCSMPEMAEYLFVLESASEEAAQAFAASFVYTPSAPS